MRILILFFALCNFLFAQYNSSMYDLIKTTYKRSFDNQIIQNYINSDSDQKTKAALLSISQSEDTSFIPDLLKQDLTKYGGEVCFAIAQIGTRDKSINFLWEYLHSSPPPNQYPKIFFAIGKIGDENDLKKLVEFYYSFDAPIFPYEGISEAILQFQIRGIKSDDAKAILENEITYQFSTKTRIEQALFALARYGGSDKIYEKILETLLNSSSSEDILQFSLMNLKSIKIFPIHPWIEEKIRNINATNLKIEYAKILSYIDLNFLHNENLFFHFLIDKNENVALQSAISFGDIILPPSFINNNNNNSIKERIDLLLLNKLRSSSYRGELFLSRLKVFQNYAEQFKMIDKLKLKSKYQIQFYAKNPNKELAFKKISEFYWNTNELKDKIEALNQILELQSESKYRSDFLNIVIYSLNTRSAPIISIAADGIDSLFISANKAELESIIEKHINEYKDDPEYLEATMSLINLSEKINKDFYESMIGKVKSSKLYSIRKFIAAKTGDNQIGYKELDKFEEIWKYAFKYKQACLKTSKGNVTIQFNSDIAPVSVANFCMLADMKFYNGITFHRVVPGFVIQAGDPTGTGWGGPGYDIVSEFSDTDYGIGYVGMASAGKDTESSQFFIMQGSYPHLDSRYTLFAKVIEGMDVVYNITEDDKIISVELK